VRPAQGVDTFGNISSAFCTVGSLRAEIVPGNTSTGGVKLERGIATYVTFRYLISWWVSCYLFQVGNVIASVPCPFVCEQVYAKRFQAIFVIPCKFRAVAVGRILSILALILLTVAGWQPSLISVILYSCEYLFKTSDKRRILDRVTEGVWYIRPLQCF